MWGERSLICQMGRAAGFPLRAQEELPALRAVLRRHFAPELAFLSAMPVILETPDYLFVHGGVPGETGLEELEAWSCMKNDEFLAQGHAFRRWCVVGHWPVTLYDPHIPSAAPLLERERHIASIDGGCVLKLDGQLNALVLPRTAGGAFSWYSYDGLPKATALDPQTARRRLRQHPLGPQPGGGAGAGRGALPLPPSGERPGAGGAHRLPL